ncbi:hypothetical protein C1J03_11190 [Sulfitobacter sp. SK012]|uniref:hypothetical protein n=1 Tax=Sulfitobacter sp. SK012 TaxID=1389005 RepID=UPI000E0B9D1B|nr:hypothetical protein [Sulfitobacter sp. SK012]AXI46532.1 hypothetical protein C1J03_11190 [Sulfitobacter sp. SK012]
MNTIYFEITDGDVKVGISITEQADGSLLFDLDVLDDTGTIGDLNGLFFDLADDSITDNLILSGTDLTGQNIDANSVSKVDGYNNINGDVVKEDGKFDVGVQFGTAGIGADDIQSTSFTLATSDGSTLSLADVLSQDFAVRLTSVGEMDGDRADSVKISGTSDPIITEPPEPTNLAVDNTMTVSNTETFSEDDMPDPLDGFFVFSLLENDSTGDSQPYIGDVVTVNGDALDAGTSYLGSNGGLLMVNSDGTVDFSANGEFDTLMGMETANTQFTYGIEGGSTATLDVEVIAFDDGGGTGEDIFVI